MESILIFLATGAAAGVLSGLFGVGGGLILVPVLTFVLPHQGVPAEAAVKTAIGTSLAVIACHSVASAHAHNKRQGVIWRVVAQLAPGLALGSFAGKPTSPTSLSGGTLKHVVAVGALLIAIQMALDLKPRTAHHLPGTAGMLAVGGGIGIASALVGIGGGSLTVPFLTWCSVELAQGGGHLRCLRRGDRRRRRRRLRPDRPQRCGDRPAHHRLRLGARLRDPDDRAIRN